MATSTFSIVRDGFMYRAVAEGVRSSIFTSASQAGLFIERKAGKDAHRAAAEAFVAQVVA